MPSLKCHDRRLMRRMITLCALALVPVASVTAQWPDAKAAHTSRAELEHSEKKLATRALELRQYLKAYQRLKQTSSTALAGGIHNLFDKMLLGQRMRRLLGLSTKNYFDLKQQSDELKQQLAQKQTDNDAASTPDPLSLFVPQTQVQSWLPLPAISRASTGMGMARRATLPAWSMPNASANKGSIIRITPSQPNRNAPQDDESAASESVMSAFEKLRGALPCPLANCQIDSNGTRVVVHGQPSATVRAVAGGSVTFVGAQSDGRYTVQLKHDAHFVTSYIGLDDVSVERGDVLSKGASLGALPADTTLLVFTLTQDGKKLDPGPWLALNKAQ